MSTLPPLFSLPPSKRLLLSFTAVEIMHLEEGSPDWTELEPIKTFLTSWKVSQKFKNTVQVSVNCQKSITIDLGIFAITNFSQVAWELISWEDAEMLPHLLTRARLSARKPVTMVTVPNTVCTGACKFCCALEVTVDLWPFPSILSNYKKCGILFTIFCVAV